jgi:hypothetical protein
MSEPAFTDTDRPKRKESCHLRDVKNPDGRTERVVYEPTSHEIVTLNPTATLIFDLCDGTRSVLEIAQTLERKFRAPADVLKRDLLDTLHLFRKTSLLLDP